MKTTLEILHKNLILIDELFFGNNDIWIRICVFKNILNDSKNHFCIEKDLYLNQMVYWHYFDKIDHLHREIAVAEILLDDPNKLDRYVHYGNPKELWYPKIIKIY